MSETLAAGLQLMLVGMGTVFSFLTLLVFATGGMSALVQRFVNIPASTSIPASASNPVEEEVAAITAALTIHREIAQQKNAHRSEKP